MIVKLDGLDDDSRRGVTDTDDAVLPLSRAVVIGVGGSGVQTISRIRSAIEAHRPDAAATSAVEFLGVDAVDLSKQEPPLPPGVKLEPRQWYNLTENPFDASEFVRRIGGGTTALNRWWDMSQQVPVGPLVDGLKQNRMLGRLAFYRESGTLMSKIQGALSRAVRITQTNMNRGEAGQDQGAVIPKVFVVASSCGGTGSSGLLEVLHKIWVAAQQLKLTPEIRVFVYLPGVFQAAINEKSPNPASEMANLQSNAFAFFRELDHFVSNSDELNDKVCNPPATPEAKIPAGQLVKQVFVVDATVSGAGQLSRVTDAYEIAAETIYQFLMTDAGRPQTAQNGTNTDTFLTSGDAYGERRVYCGIGIAAVTYPGETYRRHLAHRFADWVTRSHLLARPIDLPNQVYKDPSTASLIGKIRGLHGTVATYELPPQARELQVLAETAPEVLVDDSSVEVATRVVTNFNNAESAAVAQLQNQLRIARDVALNSLDATVRDAVLDTGRGVPYGIEMIRRAETAIRDLRAQVTEVRATNQTATPKLRNDTDALRRKLRGLTERRFVMPGTRDKAAAELGLSLQLLGSAVLGEHRADGEARFLDAALARLAELRAELEKAEQVLIQQADVFYRAWRSDELVGKDAGPVDTTALIPADAQPDIEDSKLAVEAFKEVRTAMEQLNMADVVREMYERWRRNSAGGAIFGLGSSNPDVQKKARNAFLTELSDLADLHVFQAGDVSEGAEPDTAAKRLIVPRTLKEAAERADDGSSLSHALQSLEGMSQKACWAWDVARLGDLTQRGLAAPSPSTVVVRPQSLTDEVRRHFGDGGNGLTILDGADEERIVAITTEWGVSAHALAGVSLWQSAYDGAVARIHDEPSQRRPHLDRSWAASLKPLVPQYFDRDSVLDVVAKAIMAARLLTDVEVARAVFGPSVKASDIPTVLAIRDDGDRIEWTGTLFTEDPAESTWIPRRSVSLGSTHAELVDEVGESAEYRQSSEELVKAIVLAAGRAKAISAIEALLNETFRPLNEAGNRNNQIAEAVDDITGALVELQEALEQQDLLARTATLG